jgi:hypothetical protein
MVKLALVAALIFASSSVGMPSRLLAQTDRSAAPTAEQVSEARRLFEKGLTLAEWERWEESLAAFRRSADLVPRPSTSYNIANALYRLDRPAEGLVELDRLRVMAETQRDAETLRREANLRALLLVSVAELRVGITPSDASLFIDGHMSSESGFERLVRLDPGKHSLRVERQGYVTALRQVHLERGARKYESIVLSPDPAAEAEPLAVLAAGTASTETPRDDRKPFVKRPGFWVMIGAIALIGAGTGVAVALTRKDDAPECGTTGSCATTEGLTVTSF